MKAIVFIPVLLRFGVCIFCGVHFSHQEMPTEAQLLIVAFFGYQIVKLLNYFFENHFTESIQKHLHLLHLYFIAVVLLLNGLELLNSLEASHNIFDVLRAFTSFSLSILSFLIYESINDSMFCWKLGNNTKVITTFYDSLKLIFKYLKRDSVFNNIELEPKNIKRERKKTVYKL